MTEGFDPEIDIWQRLFPFEPRCELAQQFVSQASELECVQKVFAMEVGELTEKHHQRIFVVTNETEYGIPSSEEMEAVINVWLKVCPDEASQKMLGHVPVLTEALFEEDMAELLSIRYRETVILWQRNSSNQKSSNPHLN